MADMPPLAEWTLIGQQHHASLALANYPASIGSVPNVEVSTFSSAHLPPHHAAKLMLELANLNLERHRNKGTIAIIWPLNRKWLDDPRFIHGVYPSPRLISSSVF